jgi:serine/threonine protein kinase
MRCPGYNSTALSPGDGTPRAMAKPKQIIARTPKTDCAGGFRHNETMLEDTDRIGRVFSGYRVEEFLGRGGMGVVYRARDLQLGRPVALKFVSHDASSGGASRGRLLGEAQAAAGLNHPNICTIYAVGESEGQLFIAMEYL